MALTPTPEQLKAIGLFNAGGSLAIQAGAGCLAADTVVHLNRGGKGYRTTIERVALQVGGQSRLIRNARPWDRSIPTRIARAEGGVIRLATMRTAWFSGVKPTLLLTTEDGRSIRATAEHPFLTASGEWARLAELSVGDVLRVNGGRSHRGRMVPKQNYRYAVTRHHPYQVRDSTTRPKFKVSVHRLVMEAVLNGCRYGEYLDALRHDAIRSKEFTFLGSDVHVHHIDRNTMNNDPSNLMVLTEEAHHRMHAAEGKTDNVLWQVAQDRVASIEPYGEEATYDVEVNDDPHNFVANGFIVHNTGKTACLQMLAESAPHRTGQYTAFNKLIVTDAGSRMPSNVVCSTFHSLAMRAVGRRFRHRLGSSRMKSMDVARKLQIDPFTVTYGAQRKPMSPGYLAGLTMRAVTNFCQSGDPEPTETHVPYVEGIDVPEAGGRRGWSNNREVRAHLMPAVRRAWADLCDPDGTLTYTHAAYLKFWELHSPVIAADFLMVDEFQDVPGVMLSIINQQADVQLIGVGDSAQAINGWMGARDALGSMGADHEAVLSQSFRFGPALADVANGLLARIGSHMRLTGAAPWASVVAEVAEPTAVLTRTNAEAVRTVLEAQRDGRSIHLTGGADEVRSFARGATQLMAEGWTSHHELACFSSWGEVRDYADNDEMGRELQLIVKLVDEFGADMIVECLSRSVAHDRADLVVSTAHRSKGMGWDSVKLAGDFFEPRDGEPDVSRDELMLLYVACTRAKRELDVTLVPQALGALGPKAIPLPAVQPSSAPAASAGYQGPIATRGPVEVGR